MSTICPQIIEILVANSARWRDAYIYVPANDMATIYAAKNRMPLLRSIRLELQPHDNTAVQSSDVAKRYSDFLVGATQLTRISFHDISSFWKIDWSLITVIHFSVVPPLSQSLAYLSQMPCLAELVFLGYCEGDKTSSDRIMPVTLPHLKFLYSPVAALLQRIETPALQKLHIRNDISTIANASAFKAIISRYFQPIRHLLKLEIFAHGWQDAALIIEHMPRVDHLTLHSGTPAALLEILEYYPQMGFLKSVMFMISTSLAEVEKHRLLETVTAWKRETGEDRGIGPFRNLTEMSFNLLNGYDERFVDSLEQHLTEEGMHYSFNQDLQSLLVPQFDVL